VILQGDSNSDGVADWAVTNRTDALGNYLFPNLATNVRYRVSVDTTSLPGTGITATGDPDDDGVNAGNGATGSADNLWNNAGAGWFSRCGMNTWKERRGTAQSWDITNVTSATRERTRWCTGWCGWTWKGRVPRRRRAGISGPRWP
jgi:hypothetical protein